MELKQDLKYELGVFCKNAFDIIKVVYPKIRGIVVQLNGEDLLIGTNVSGSFGAKYYNSKDPHQTSVELRDYVHTYSKCILDCKGEIGNSYPGSKLRSFNIFYKPNQKGLATLNVCKNRIGNRSMERCRLFNEFSV
jgi:hypothetical protein